MNYLLLSVLVFCSIYSTVKCDYSNYKFVPFCKNYSFKYEGKEINGYFSMGMVRGLFSSQIDEISESMLNNHQSNLAYYVKIDKPLMRINENTVRDKIARIIAKKPLLEQGYFIDEVADKKFLDNCLKRLQMKPEDSLVFENLDQYYNKQILKLLYFHTQNKKDTGIDGVSVSYE